MLWQHSLVRLCTALFGAEAQTPRQGCKHKAAMASAWKNVVPRREHRERPQPEARQHLGLLEKHKDYVKRARAHHSKRDRIVALKRRAELRNKDEFYHGMAGAKTKVRCVSLGTLGRACCSRLARSLAPSSHRLAHSSSTLSPPLPPPSPFSPLLFASLCRTGST